MVGLKYHRIIRNMTQSDLAAELNISTQSLNKYENVTDHLSMPAEICIMISDRFGIPIDDVVSIYPDDLLKKRKKCRAESEPINYIGRYMKTNHYTLRTMASELGVSYEHVRKLRESPVVNRKYSCLLAKKGNISMSKFVKIYGE